VIENPCTAGGDPPTPRTTPQQAQRGSRTER
jgi:hypothetical protein